MRALIFYIDAYPQRLHHPKESDQLFRRLRERSRDPLTGHPPEQEFAALLHRIVNLPPPPPPPLGVGPAAGDAVR